MPNLKFFLLGPPRLERDGEQLVIDTRKTMALMAYLAVTGEPHSRDALATLLWPESEPRRARSTLRRNLSVLNKTLDGPWLAVDRDTIGLNPNADLWLDVDQFHQLLQNWQTHKHPENEVCVDCLSDLVKAVTLYRGDFLAGFTLRDSPQFDEWQTFQTEHLKRELAGALEKMVRGHSLLGELELAINVAKRWLGLNPLHEPAHRQLMQLYANNGDRSAALRQYQNCVRLLKEELDVPPEAETVALYEQIRTETERHRKSIADTFAIVDGDTPAGMEKNLLGQGGMGNVFRGLNTQSGEAVAIKVLKPEIVASDPDLVDRFIREGEALRQLNHPNIVKMLAASEQNGQYYLVMEYVSGGSLHDLIAKEGSLPVERVLEIALDLADALTRAHRLNIIHRDLKPPNVLMAEDGTPRLTDFGLARQMEGPRTTQTGVVMGTVDYLSPEGCEGQALDERADIWAFGVILFEMLTGQRPFVGETLPSTLAAIISQPVPDLTEHRSDIPAPLTDLIGRMLEKNINRRIPSVRLVGAELEAIIADRPLTPTTPIAVPTGPPPPSPYRGLFAFREEDAPFFFGREEYTRRLVEAAQRQAMVAVVGSSGSGKSSVVFAGLLAQLLQEAKWLIATFRPGSQPFQALAGTLLPLLEPDLSETDQLVEVRKLAERLGVGDLPLANVVERILQKNPASDRFMLVADQFEELYTLCPEPEIRHNFLDVLFEAIDLQQYQSTPTFTFVFTLRADFLEQALTHRPFSDALQDNDIKLGPMTREELGQAIEQPAELQGVTFESGLVDRILDDVGEEPGNLPLLEFALTILWEQQQLRRLTHSGYEAIDRVEGALTRHADEVYAGLTQVEQEAARRIFTQLVRPGEGTEDTRRVAVRSELSEVDWALAQRLADARLVVTGQDPAGNETVEVVHEALIRNWGRLRQWMEADRTFRAWQERLRAAMRQWDATGQDKDALLRGASLAEAENWLVERETDLSQAERAFVDASLGARRQREEAERAQQVRERSLEQSALRRLRVIVGVLVAASIVGIALTIIIFNQSQNNQRSAEQAQAASTAAIASQATAEAEQQVALAAEATADAERQIAIAERDRADAESKVAISRQLAIQVADELDSDNFDTALLLAIEAAHIAENVDTWTALRQAVTHPRPLQMTLTGHTDDLSEYNGAAWSPDGSRILTASFDGTARIWDTNTGEELLVLDHTDEVNGAHWNGDGSRILTMSDDRTARVWDANTGEELVTLSGHEDIVDEARWSPDESRILTDDGDTRAIRVWDAESGQELLTLSGHTNFIQYARWNADGSRIITNSADRTARIWDAATGEELLVLAGHDDGVMQARWSPDKSRILTASVDGTVKVREAELGEEMLSFTAHASFLWTAIWNADGSRILTSSADGTAKIWDAVTGQNLLTLTGHTSTVRQATWNTAESLILTASGDNTARVWDATTGEELARFGHSGGVLSASWSPDERLILTASADDTARVWAWDAITGEPNPELPVLVGSANDYFQAVWNQAETLILTASADPRGYARIWDAVTGEELLTLTGHTDVVFRVVWNKAESRILTASADGTARVWDAQTGSELLTLSGHTDGVNWAAWNKDESRVLTNSSDGTARVWGAETGEVLFILSGHTASLNRWSEAGAGWNPDESRILTASLDGTARIWDAETGEQLLILSGHSDEVHQAVWNADGSLILTRSKDGTARVWNAHTGEMILTLNHSNRVSEARWSQDEKRILTADFDGTVHIWGAEPGEELLTLTGHEDNVVQARWNGDDSQIVTVGRDSTMRLWNAETGTARVIIDPRVAAYYAVWNQDDSRILVTGDGGRGEQYFTRLEDLIAVGCERLTRNLTPAEWQQFMGDQPYQATCPNLPVPEE